RSDAARQGGGRPRGRGAQAARRSCVGKRGDPMTDAAVASHASQTECGGLVELSEYGHPMVHIGELELRLVCCTRCGYKAYLSPAIQRCPRMVRKSPAGQPVGRV